MHRRADGFWEKGDVVRFHKRSGNVHVVVTTKSQGTILLSKTKDFERCAVRGSMCERSPHRLKDLRIGDLVDLKLPTNSAWQTATIEQWENGQIKCSYANQNKERFYWVHADNIQEIRRRLQRTTFLIS